MALPQIGLEAVLKDEQFQAGMAKMLTTMGHVEQKSTQTTQASSQSWNWLSVAVGSAVGTIIGTIMGQLIPAMTQMATTGMNTFRDWNEGLDKLVDQFGFTGEEASKWSVAMSMFGVPVEEGAMQLNFFTRGLADSKKIMAGSKEAVPPFQKALDKLGISAFGANGKLKSFNDVMPEVLDAFSKLAPGIEASDIAMNLFGARGGSKMLDFLMKGKKGLSEADKIAREFGLTMSTEMVEAVENFSIEMSKMNIKVKGIWTQIGQAFQPAMEGIVNYISYTLLPAINTWISANKDKLLKGLQDLGNWVGGTFLPAMQNMATWISTSLLPALGTIAAWMGTTGAAALKAFSDWFTATAIPAFETVRIWVVENWPKIQKSITDAWDNIRPQLEAMQKWFNTDGKDALQIFYDKLQESAPYISQWVQLIKDMKDASYAASVELGKLNQSADETGEHFNALGFMIKGTWDNIKYIMDSAFEFIHGIQEAWQAASRGDMDGFLAGMVSAFHGAYSISLPGILNRFAQWVGEMMGRLTYDIALAIWNGADDIVNALIAPWVTAINWIRDNWGWHSPPTIFVKLGEDVAKALQIGMGSVNMGQMVTQQLTPSRSSIVNNYGGSSSATNFNFASSMYGQGGVESSVRDMINRRDRGLL